MGGADKCKGGFNVWKLAVTTLAVMMRLAVLMWVMFCGMCLCDIMWWVWHDVQQLWQQQGVSSPAPAPAMLQANALMAGSRTSGACILCVLVVCLSLAPMRRVCWPHLYLVPIPRICRGCVRCDASCYTWLVCWCTLSLAEHLPHPSLSYSASLVKCAIAQALTLTGCGTQVQGPEVAVWHTSRLSRHISRLSTCRPSLRARIGAWACRVRFPRACGPPA